MVRLLDITLIVYPVDICHGCVIPGYVYLYISTVGYRGTNSVAVRCACTSGSLCSQISTIRCAYYVSLLVILCIVFVYYRRTGLNYNMIIYHTWMRCIRKIPPRSTRLVNFRPIVKWHVLPSSSCSHCGWYCMA